MAPTSVSSRSTRPPRSCPQAAHAEANIIFGAVIDDALGDEVRVTVIAAGFDGGMPKRRSDGNVLRQSQPAQSQDETRAAAQQIATRAPAQPRSESTSDRPATTTFAPSQQSQQGQQSTQAPSQRPKSTEQPAPSRPARQVQFEDDDLDVPDFLK